MSEIENYGRHSVRHGDVADAAGLARLMGGERAAIMNTDPPWGGGNIKYWATLNAKMNPESAPNIPVSLDVLLGSVFEAADAYVDKYLLVAYGVRWVDEIQRRGMAAGFQARGVLNVLYKGGAKLLPLHLHVFTRGPQPIPDEYVKAVEGTVGYKCVMAAVAPLAEVCLAADPNAVIMDPCCGMGYTAQAAIDTGMRFRGNELNRARLEKTIKRFGA